MYKLKNKEDIGIKYVDEGGKLQSFSLFSFLWNRMSTVPADGKEPNAQYFLDIDPIMRKLKEDEPEKEIHLEDAQWNLLKSSVCGRSPWKQGYSEALAEVLHAVKDNERFDLDDLKEA